MSNVRIAATDFLFGIFTVIIIAISYLSVSRIQSLISTSNLLNRNRKLETKLEQTLLYLTDAANAQREYLLTNDTVFLNQYVAISDRIKASVGQLDSLMADSEQRKTLSAIKEITGNKFLLEYSLNNARAKGYIPIAPLLYQNRKLMDSLRLRIRHIEEDDAASVNNEIKKRNQLVFVTPLISATIVFITLVLAAVSYFTIRRDKARLSDLNTQLKEKNIELEQRNAELSSFYDIYSHDLQEPLRKIQLFSERIESTEAANLSSRGADYFSRIRQAAQRMQALIQALVNFSQAASAASVFVSTDLDQVLWAVQNTLKESISARKAVIECSGLPTLHADPVQMRELLLHLVGNALKYARAGVPPLIKISAQKITHKEVPGKVKHKGNFWRIDVQDNGIGFEPAYGEKIFELFEKLQSPATQESTGIGLAICRKIVYAHHGAITATGQPGEGAVFSVFLPE